jgi:hypothetical protein
MKNRNNYFTIVKTSRTGDNEHSEMQGLFINQSQARKGLRDASTDFIFECDNSKVFWCYQYVDSDRAEIEHGETDPSTITTFEIFKLVKI